MRRRRVRSLRVSILELGRREEFFEKKEEKNPTATNITITIQVPVPAAAPLIPQKKGKDTVSRNDEQKRNEAKRKKS